jgi:hypothetical protein
MQQADLDQDGGIERGDRRQADEGDHGPKPKPELPGAGANGCIAAGRIRTVEGVRRALSCVEDRADRDGQDLEDDNRDRDEPFCMGRGGPVEDEHVERLAGDGKVPKAVADALGKGGKGVSNAPRRTEGGGERTPKAYAKPW